MATMFNHKRDTFVQSESGYVYKTSRDCVGPRDKVLGKKAALRIMKQKALEDLRETLKPGDTVHGIVRSVARSGMSRRIDFYKLVGSEQIYLTGSFAALMETDDFDHGLRVNGCGMDMIFATVYNVSSMLWPNGAYCTGDARTCQSNEHTNGDWVYDSAKLHRDGGYALKSAQL
jgi:hypothetical protein